MEVLTGPQSGFRMEPSWTEPPQFAWVFISVRERPVCRGQSVVDALTRPERCWPDIRRREGQHVTQGHGIMQPDKGRR